MIERIKHCYQQNGFWVSAIFVAMIIMCVISIIAITLTLFQKCFPCYISCTSDGVAYFLSMFKPFYPLFSGTIMLMTIYVALISYVRAKKVEAMKALQDLRNMLMKDDNVKIHDLLECEKENEKEKQKSFEKEYATRQGTVYNYLGILELSKFYLDEGIISVDQLKNQFGYRIENVYANPLICEWIMKHPGYWRTLDELKKKITK